MTFFWRLQVAELTKAEEELRREAAASGQLLRDENARLTAERAALAESYDALLAERQKDREGFESKVSGRRAGAWGSWNKGQGEMGQEKKIMGWKGPEQPRVIRMRDLECR